MRADLIRLATGIFTNAFTVTYQPQLVTYQVPVPSSLTSTSRSLLNAIVRLVDGGSRIHHGGKERLQILIASRSELHSSNITRL